MLSIHWCRRNYFHRKEEKIKFPLFFLALSDNVDRQKSIKKGSLSMPRICLLVPGWAAAHMEVGLQAQATT